VVDVPRRVARGSNPGPVTGRPSWPVSASLAPLFVREDEQPSQQRHGADPVPEHGRGLRDRKLRLLHPEHERTFVSFVMVRWTVAAGVVR